jgi:hypothetical protein
MQEKRFTIPSLYYHYSVLIGRGMYAFDKYLKEDEKVVCMLSMRVTGHQIKKPGRLSEIQWSCELF